MSDPSAERRTAQQAALQKVFGRGTAAHLELLAFFSRFFREHGVDLEPVVLDSLSLTVQGADREATLRSFQAAGEALEEDSAPHSGWNPKLPRLSTLRVASEVMVQSLFRMNPIMNLEFLAGVSRLCREHAVFESLEELADVLTVVTLTLEDPTAANAAGGPASSEPPPEATPA